MATFAPTSRRLVLQVQCKAANTSALLCFRRRHNLDGDFTGIKQRCFGSLVNWDNSSFRSGSSSTTTRKDSIATTTIPRTGSGNSGIHSDSFRLERRCYQAVVTGSLCSFDSTTTHGKSASTASFNHATTTTTTATTTTTKRFTSTAVSSGSFFTASSLMPLLTTEVARTASIIRQLVGISIQDDPDMHRLRFVAISLHEAAVPARQAEVVTLDPTTGLATEYIVNLQTDTVVHQMQVPAGQQPLFTPDDCDLAEAIVQASPVVAAALRERYGITDISRVACDPWSVHLPSDMEVQLTRHSSTGQPQRLIQTWLYYREFGDALEDNHYAHPIDLLPVVDLNSRTVVEIANLDRQPPPKISDISVNYHRNLLSTNTYLQTTWRDDIKALNVAQPDGPSFTVSEESVVEWQKWSFQVGFNYREGLVLHNIAYAGRPIVKRASLVEMAVPYADPYTIHARKCAFDVGDYGLGYCANSLQLGCDCLGHIHYFDAVLPDAAGNPVVKKSAICMHEEDQGLLWKHVEYRNGHSESRRSRELVVSFIATVVNYEYLFYWRFKQDGSIDFEIKLSGELSTNLLSPAEEASGQPAHGVMVAPGVNAQLHQHMFCARLDMAVDGVANTVSELDLVRQPLDPVKNPYGNAFGVVETVLETEQAAIRKADASRARTWKISNAAGCVNPINGKPTAYKLIPFTRGPAQPTLMVDPSSAVATKGAFANANLWVTPYTPNERFPAGEYTPQGDGTVGLPQWTAANRNIVATDVVLWHAFGVCHVPRVEDFPVMPAEVTGFTLKPDNFFAGNPAIDIPPTINRASALTAGSNASSSSCCGSKQ